jgi:starch synthase
MRYGTVPISSCVGGLRDTIFDVAQDNEGHPANGFLFDGDDAGSMVAAVQRAFNIFSARPGRWHALQQTGMRSRFDWANPAREYIAIYRDVAPEDVRDRFSGFPEKDEGSKVPCDSIPEASKDWLSVLSLA